MNEDNHKHICFQCVGEPYLAQLIEKDGECGVCSYCGKSQACITITDLADRVEAAFADHYICTSGHKFWERDCWPSHEAIMRAAEIASDIATDVLKLLDHWVEYGEESNFSRDTFYVEKGANAQDWIEEWCYFEQLLKTEARFFSRSAVDLLARVFVDIDKLKTSQRHPLVVDAGPDRTLTHLYRARVFQSPEELEKALCRPDLHLGPPPAPLARAGRMNACGISVFYGATEADVALAEVRPPVGSKVAIAKFRMTRPLRLLDLTAIKDVWEAGSIFDPSFKFRLERIAFLKTFGERMTQPVMPDDEALDYLPTQAVADFLATQSEPRLDGIIFDSVQSEVGRNVVLFHKAARVEALVFPEGTEISASCDYQTEDGWDIHYSVSEAVPKIDATGLQNKDERLIGLIPSPSRRYPVDADHREVTLGVDPSSIEVHQVKSVKVSSERHVVYRHRHEKVRRKF